MSKILDSGNRFEVLEVDDDDILVTDLDLQHDARTSSIFPLNTADDALVHSAIGGLFPHAVSTVCWCYVKGKKVKDIKVGDILEGEFDFHPSLTKRMGKKPTLILDTSKKKKSFNEL